LRIPTYLPPLPTPPPSLYTKPVKQPSKFPWVYVLLGIASFLIAAIVTILALSSFRETAKQNYHNCVNSHNFPITKDLTPETFQGCIQAIRQD
jgi:hypothetical protein